MGAPHTDADEAQAFSHASDAVGIKTSSWGPPDDGATVAGPGPLAISALSAGVRNGRRGLGTVFVFANGNGGNADDDCNYDGYANSEHVTSVAAIGRAGERPPYGEWCTASLVNTYSSDAFYSIVRDTSRLK